MALRFEAGKRRMQAASDDQRGRTLHRGQQDHLLRLGVLLKPSADTKQPGDTVNPINSSCTIITLTLRQRGPLPSKTRGENHGASATTAGSAAPRRASRSPRASLPALHVDVTIGEGYTQGQGWGSG